MNQSTNVLQNINILCKYHNPKFLAQLFYTVRSWLSAYLKGTNSIFLFQRKKWPHKGGGVSNMYLTAGHDLWFFPSKPLPSLPNVINTHLTTLGKNLGVILDHTFLHSSHSSILNSVSLPQIPQFNDFSQSLFPTLLNKAPPAPLTWATYCISS